MDILYWSTWIEWISVVNYCWVAYWILYVLIEESDFERSQPRKSLTTRHIGVYDWLGDVTIPYTTGLIGVDSLTIHYKATGVYD